MIFDPDAVIDRIRHQRAKLVLIASDVRSVRNDDGQAFICHAALRVQILYQMRNDQILPHPEAAHVAHDERDAAAGADALRERKAADRLRQTFQQRGADVADRRIFLPVQHGKHVFLFQRHLDGALPICERVVFHRNVSLLE